MEKSNLENTFNFLFDIEQGYLKYIFKASLLVLLIALPVAITLTAIFPDLPLISEKLHPIDDAFWLILLAPLLETALMAGLFLIINIFTKNFMAACLLSAVFWAVFHGVSFPIQGIAAFFSFFIFSVAFNVWWKISFWAGFLVTMTIHMILNTVVTVLGFYALQFAT